MDVGSNPTSSIFSICSQVAEGIGLIIRFSMRHHWFESSQMHIMKLILHLRLNYVQTLNFEIVYIDRIADRVLYFRLTDFIQL